MRKICAILAAFMICNLLITISFAQTNVAEPENSVSDTVPDCTLSPDQIISETAVMIDADTGQVLFEKDMNRKMFPASLTKIMTAILALENGDMDSILTADQEIIDDVYSYGLETSHIALTVGERISLKDALYACLLESANDATALIAKSIGGSLDHFVEMMNEKAQELGAGNTHFVNSHGLHDDNHYTTAYDLALITKYALTLPDFEKIISTDQYTMAPTNNQESERYFWNQNQMIQSSYYYDEDVVGGKLGWTEEANNTMMALGERDGRRLICVLLKSVAANAKYQDCEALLNYGFENFKSIPIDIAKEIPAGVDIMDKFGQLAGDVTISSAPTVSYLIHNHLTEDDVQVKIHVPEYYLLDQEIQAGFTIQLKDGVDCMPNEPLDFALETKSHINANMSMARETPKSGSQIFLIIGLGLLAFLLLLVIALFVIRAVVRRNVRQRYSLRSRKVHIDQRIRRRL